MLLWWPHRAQGFEHAGRQEQQVEVAKLFDKTGMEHMQLSENLML